MSFHRIGERAGERGNGERGYYWCATVAYILYPLSALSLMCESGKVEEEEEEEEEEGLSFKDNAPLFLPFSFRPIPLYLFPHCSFPLLPSFPPLVQHQSNVRSCLSGGGGQGRRKDNRASAAVQTVNIGTFSILLLFCYIRSGEASLNGGRFCCSVFGGLHYCEVLVLFVVFTSSITNIFFVL